MGREGGGVYTVSGDSGVKWSLEVELGLGYFVWVSGGWSWVVWRDGLGGWVWSVMDFWVTLVV